MLSQTSVQPDTPRTASTFTVEKPFFIDAVLLDGRGVGDLILGESKLDTVVRMFAETSRVTKAIPARLKVIQR